MSVCVKEQWKDDGRMPGASTNFRPQFCYIFARTMHYRTAWCDQFFVHCFDSWPQFRIRLIQCTMLCFVEQAVSNLLENRENRLKLAAAISDADCGGGEAVVYSFVKQKKKQKSLYINIIYL